MKTKTVIIKGMEEMLFEAGRLDIESGSTRLGTANIRRAAEMGYAPAAKLLAELRHEALPNMRAA